MYIQPQTNIRIISGCPLDADYKNTLLFNSAAEQASYFLSLVKYSWSENTYQRTGSNVIKLPIACERLYDCNYLMFQNSHFTSKWFYAFIDRVEYINDVTCAVHYTIDVMQTWLFDWEFNDCFVEREHSESDAPGDNLVPENLETGEYVNGVKSRTGLQGMSSVNMSDFGFVCLATRNYSGTNITADGGFWYNGVFAGLYFNCFDDIYDFASWVTDEVYDTPECIVALYQIPKFMYAPFKAAVDAAGGDKIVNIDNTVELTDIISRPAAIDGYTPRNKKLLAYPYSFISVNNFNGGNSELHYEQFTRNQDAPHFAIRFSIGAKPTITLYPEYYKWSGVSNLQEQLTLSTLPLCPYSTDTFAAWLAQNSGGVAVALGSSLASAGAGLALGAINPVLGTLSVGANIASTVAQMKQHSIQPPQAHGVQGDTSNVQMFMLDYEFSQVTITHQFAEIIDSYFDRFGYATKKTKQPNRSSRAHWNYVKTIGCTIKGSIPADDEKKICEIHDAGVTYWKSGAEVGNYSLDNSIA